MPCGRALQPIAQSGAKSGDGDGFAVLGVDGGVEGADDEVGGHLVIVTRGGLW